MTTRDEQAALAAFEALLEIEKWIPGMPALAGARPAFVSGYLAALTAQASPVGGDQAARDVLAERRRQVEAEDWTLEHDGMHDSGEMAQAAACYALHTEPVGNIGDYLRFWPWDAEWWKPKDRRRNLVRAAALILAEIERLDRAATPALPADSQSEGPR
jgi:hypothetical protein